MRPQDVIHSTTLISVPQTPSPYGVRPTTPTSGGASELVWQGFLAHASKSTRRRPILAEYFILLPTQISSNLKKLVCVCRNGNAESIDLLYFSIQLDLQKLFRDS